MADRPEDLNFRAFFAFFSRGPGGAGIGAGGRKKLFILLQELCRRGSCGTRLRIRPGEIPDPAVRNMAPPAKASFGSGIRRGKILFGIGPFRRPKSEAPVHGIARPSPLTEAGRLTKSICESLKDSANLM
ncbi:hypothetical protein B4135_2951 [Caldibacillus debilis]|uniref:Uncharacterized protein n=1 Tax=Caldibacillus debilis TaxID=301148 RepID=A0A150LLN6_9BACI|nr:hypothetical protein B4135_2951 [Caldibacillus debilis]